MTKRLNTTKIVALLAVLCMITSAFVGSTLAKYTTKAEGGDTARVAKWGITLTTEGVLFAEQYQDAPITDTNDTNITVQVAATGTNVVAPGTKNEEGLKFSISGKPEVDFKFDAAVEAKDISLAAGQYDDATTADTADKFTLSEAYNPVKFKLTKDGTAVKEDVTLAEIETYIENLSSVKVDANETWAAAGEYVLTWAWDINGNDAADTYIGNEQNLQEISFELTMTATQID